MNFSTRIAPCRASLRLAASAAAVSLAFPALAQSPADSTLKEVVVTATRIEQPVTDVVADMSVIDSEQIERMGVTSVPEILANLPGLQAITHGNASRLYIRGTDSRMTALYIDGVRIDAQDGYSLLGGGVPWDLVPVSQIDRIEVLRGPASAIYGSDAMGGVVQIFSKRGEKEIKPYVNLSMGSNNTKSLTAGIRGGAEAFDYWFGVNRESSDGYDTRPDLIHNPSTESYDKTVGNMQLGYKFSTAHRIEISTLSSRLDSHYVPWGGGKDNATVGELSATAIKWKADWSDFYASRLTVTQSRIANRDDTPKDYLTVMEGFLLENLWRMKHGTFSANLEQKHDRFNTTKTIYDDPAFGGARTQDAVSLGYGANYGAHTIQLNARSDHDSNFGVHDSAAVAYGYKLNPQWRLTLSNGSSFRAPTLEQVFGPYGDAQLKPEVAHSKEAGIIFTQGPSMFKAVAYENEITDMITSSMSQTTCSAGFFCYYNVGKASIKGITLSGNFAFNNYLLNASYDVMDPKNETNGLNLNLRAKHLATLGIQRYLGDWQVGGNLLGVGERFDDAANTVKLPGYVLLNINATHKLSREWQLQINLNNLGDVKYEQVGSYAAPGRRIYAGVKWEPR